MTSFKMPNCSECQSVLKNDTYTKCWKCLPKCDCGKLVKPPFKKCFTCNQDTKKDLCETCKDPFNGRGKYTKCYTCNKKP